MYGLEVKHLTKRFGNKEVVGDVSFAVEKGSLLALLGPSGCGKTTAVRLIAGLETPDAGEILIGGRLASGNQRTVISQKMRRVGMVFQDLALWPHMTVYENVEFGLKAKGASRAERQKRIAAVLDKTALQKYAREYPGRLSGGQRQLVAIARAIVTEPELLLMDEPLSSIDVKLREDVRQEIRNIQQVTRITTVYVTHDQEDAFLLANQVVVMNAGRVEQTGSPEEIYLRPQSLFVAGFIGESNIIPVETVAEGRVLTPWGEVVCNTRVGKKASPFLFFRPHQVSIHQQGLCIGIIVNRRFMGDGYRYYVSTNGIEIIVQDQKLFEIGMPVRFSIHKMEVLFS